MTENDLRDAFREYAEATFGPNYNLESTEAAAREMSFLSGVVWFVSHDRSAAPDRSTEVAHTALRRLAEIVKPTPRPISESETDDCPPTGGHGDRRCEGAD